LLEPTRVFQQKGAGVGMSDRIEEMDPWHFSNGEGLFFRVAQYGENTDMKRSSMQRI